MAFPTTVSKYSIFPVASALDAPKFSLSTDQLGSAGKNIARQASTSAGISMALSEIAHRNRLLWLCAVGA